MSQTPFSILDWNSKSRTDALPAVALDQTNLVGGDDYAFGPLTPTLAALLPDSERRRAESRVDLQAAGYYKPHAAMNLAAIRYLCIIIPLLFLGVLLVLAPKTLERPILFAMLAVPAAGWALPRLIVRGKAAARKSQIEAGIPDLLDMLNMCVSQGMTLPTAFDRVAKELGETHPDLRTELQIVGEQARLGSLDQALENLRRRIDVPEVHSFTTLLMQTERMGTSISAALAEYSENMREALKQRAEERGNKAAFKLLFPTALCLMPAVFLILLGPAVVELSNFANRNDTTLERANDLIRQTGRAGFRPNR